MVRSTFVDHAGNGQKELRSQEKTVHTNVYYILKNIQDSLIQQRVVCMKTADERISEGFRITLKWHSWFILIFIFQIVQEFAIIIWYPMIGIK